MHKCRLTEAHTACECVGVAGLSCGVRLHAAGVPVRILEASDGVGGRVRTDPVDGFLLDRGFQIFLTSYPEARALLDYGALELQPFYAGAPFHTPPHAHIPSLVCFSGIDLNTGLGPRAGMLPDTARPAVGTKAT